MAAQGAGDTGICNWESVELGSLSRTGVSPDWDIEEEDLRRDISRGARWGMGSLVSP